MSAAHVYVAQDESGAIKVGISKSVIRRMMDLRSVRGGSTNLVWLTALRDDAFPIERTAHALLNANRIRGEWFSVSSSDAINAVLAAISRIEAGDYSLRRRLPFKKKPPPYIVTNIRVTAQLKKRVSEAALADRRSVSQWIEGAILDALAKVKRKAK